MSMDRYGIATDAFAVTPHDTDANLAQALYAGSGGAIAVRTEAGTTLTFANVAAGTVLPVRVNRVLATGTTATGIIGFK